MLARSLRGKFALVVWDAEKRRAVIARDRLGVKPLYYARSGDLLVFASELKSVLASGLVRAELDVEAIESYLALGLLPRPVDTASRRCPSSCRLTPCVVEDGSVRERALLGASVPGGARQQASTDREYADGLVEVLDEAVRLRLMSDVPLGAMLSGGLDSSVVVALMARHSTSPVKTFSVAFSEDAHGERAFRRTTRRELHSGPTITSSSSRSATSRMPLEELVWHLDEPLADLSSLGLYALSKLAAEHVTVALSGQGADELLGGYPDPSKRRPCGHVGASARRPAPASGPPIASHVPSRYRRAAAAITAGDPVARFLAQSSSLDAASAPAPPDAARALVVRQRRC